MARHARYDKLVQWARDAGVEVFEKSGAPPQTVPDELAEWSGMPQRGIKVQGTFKPSGWPKSGPSVHLNLPDHSPEWLAVGVLAHELGHFIDRKMGTYGVGHQFAREVRASERGFELLTALDIRPSDAVRSVFNMSICSYRPTFWSYNETKEYFL